MKRDTITVTTIDNVDLEFELAGIGSRLLAGILDFIISLAIILFCCLCLYIMGTRVNEFVIALAILSYFAISWGYHIFFECLCQGQTPGKKIMAIQVLNQKGHFVSWKESLLRNLVRFLDSLPPPLYFFGGLSIGVDDKRQRFGDMTAGTIVVKKWKATGGRTFGASWISRLEKGEMPHALRLKNGTLDARQIEIIVSFIERRGAMQQSVRRGLAWKIAEPLLDLCGEEREDYAENDGRGQRSEALLEKIYISLHSTSSQKSEEKLEQWKAFAAKTAYLLKRRLRRLKALTANELEQLLRDYRYIISDLARARSKSTDTETLRELNRLAVMGHQLLNKSYQRLEGAKISFFSHFPSLVRQYSGHMVLSASLFIAPAIAAFIAIQWNHELAYDLVPESFLDFAPSSEENMHEIPSLVRPVAATSYITNNIQVTFFAFVFGVTAGVGTAYLLIYNGIYFGAIFSWMLLQGHGKAFLGWVLPHASTEILAIILAGGAGFILADAVLRPGRITFKESLKQAAGKAVVIEIGCMAMLLIAGLIEGFVSPSSIGFPVRILYLAASCLVWSLYFGFDLRTRSKSFIADT